MDDSRIEHFLGFPDNHSTTTARRLSAMKCLLKFADCNLQGSLAFKARERRGNLIKCCIEKVRGNPKSILDVGGTVDFWKNLQLGEDVNWHITLVNIEAYDTGGYPHIVSITGDGRDMSIFPDKAFDLVLSNSVIEHVGGHADQKRFADEIQRVGTNYVVQTPDILFPIEPHFLFPYFQFLPYAAKVFLIRHFDLGYYRKTKHPEEINRIIDSVHLLGRCELEGLFPEADIVREYLFGLPQSLVVIGGPDLKDRRP